jgi:plasmid stabilization system protein ParE
MARVVVTERAKQDVRDILTDLDRRAGLTVASRYAADFKNVYVRLAEFPLSGSPRLELGYKARVKFVHPYIVVYDCDADTATVLRVLHGRRDITIELISR